MPAVTVGDGVAKRVRDGLSGAEQLEQTVRVVVECAIPVVGDGAERGADIDPGHGQTVAINVGVVEQDGSCGERRVLIGFEPGAAVVLCHGRIVDGVDRHGHGRGICAAVTVIDRVGKAVGSVEIRIGRVDICSVVERDRAVARSAQRDAKRVAIRIRIVGQQVDLDRAVFVRRHSIVPGNRVAVCRR